MKRKPIKKLNIGNNGSVKLPEEREFVEFTLDGENCPDDLFDYSDDGNLYDSFYNDLNIDKSKLIHKHSINFTVNMDGFAPFDAEKKKQIKEFLKHCKPLFIDPGTGGVLTLNDAGEVVKYVK